MNAENQVTIAKQGGVDVILTAMAWHEGVAAVGPEMVDTLRQAIHRLEVREVGTTEASFDVNEPEDPGAEMREHEVVHSDDDVVPVLKFSAWHPWDSFLGPVQGQRRPKGEFL